MKTVYRPELLFVDGRFVAKAELVVGDGGEVDLGCQMSTERCPEPLVGRQRTAGQREQVARTAHVEHL